ncbi:class I SAM-dependent DNA methyltransferase [Oceanibium sediminis]|uniref:class I SAM-dependent DNA methyltransferase n=1 Tax=Oceanibium sediminis TaxID=2026339 RepID=UPI000DD2D662|nr:class I SAM-dependent methyltransferase [Oceanibium sediminis]
MTVVKTFLDKVYDVDGGEETRALYDEWADTYDEEVDANGYATPARAAAALRAHAIDRSAPLLDIGCGTGISGDALADAGFTTIDGCDFSDEMLKKAEETGAYRTLFKTDLSLPLQFKDGAYTLISAIGVLNPGHGPAEVLDQILAKLPRGGLVVFSLNDHAMADGSYEGRLNESLDSGYATLLFREYGPHLPKIDLNSTVYVLEKN